MQRVSKRCEGFLLATMQESSLSFSPISSEEAGFFKLLELTPELVTLIEEATIKHSDAPR